MDKNRVDFEQNPFHYHEGAPGDGITDGLIWVLNLGISEYQKSLSSGELEHISIIRNDIAREIGKFFTYTLPSKEEFLKIRYSLSNIFDVDAAGRLQDISKISEDSLKKALAIVKVTNNCKLFDKKILEIKNLLGVAEDMTMENIQKLSLDHMDRSDLPKLYKVYKISHGLRSRFDSEKGRIMKKISNVSIARIKMINQSTTSDGTNNGVSKLSQPGNDVAIILSQINDILGLKCLKLTTKNIQTAIDNISRSNYFIRDLKSIEKKLSHIDTKNLPSAAIEMLTRIKRKIRLVIIERKGTEKPKISNKQEIRNWISNMEKYLEQVDVAYQKLLESQNDETAISKEKVRLFRSYLYNQYENTIVIPLGLDDAKKAVTLSRWEKKKTIRILLERIIAWGQLYGPTGMSEEDFFDLCKHGSVLHGIHTIANKFEQERSNLFPQKKEKIIINDILVPSHITHNDTKQKKKISSQRKTLREIQQEISDMKKRIEQYTSNYDHMDLAKKVCNDLLERIAGLSPREGSDDTKKIQEIVDRTNKQLDIIEQRKKERVNLLTGSSSSNTDENKNNVPSKLPEDEIDRRTGRPKWNIDIGL